MSGQLFSVPADPESLTPRQRFAYDLLGRPRSAEEVGVWLHAARAEGFFGPERRPCSCSWGTPCWYAAEVGRAILSILRHKGLTIRRRSGMWERRDGSSQASSQGEAIPF